MAPTAWRWQHAIERSIDQPADRPDVICDAALAYLGQHQVFDVYLWRHRDLRHLDVTRLDRVEPEAEEALGPP